jgi:hypothetical protein
VESAADESLPQAINELEHLMGNRETTWETYEQVAAYLLNQVANEFGLERVEGKQSVVGQRSGTTWSIDARGVTEDVTGFVIIECRRYTTSRLDQEALGGLAYRIRDTGAKGGIVVSPLGLQEGAAKVAAAERIHSVELNAASTTTEYIMRFLKTVMVGLKPEGITISATILSARLEPADEYEV